MAEWLKLVGSRPLSSAGIAGWLAEQFMKSDMGLADEHRARHRRRGRSPALFSAFLASSWADGSATWSSALLAPVLLIWIVRMVRSRAA